MKVITGNFNGNGCTDIALLQQLTGSFSAIPVAFAEGDGEWDVTRGRADKDLSTEFAKLAKEQGVRVLTGDFNGSRLTDIALVNQLEGWDSIPIAFARGDGDWEVANCKVGPFAKWATFKGVEVITGDFTGNGRTDIALVRLKGWNSIPIAFSRGDGQWNLTNKNVLGNFAKLAMERGVEIITGDFNGNGRTDIALIKRSPGWSTIPIAFANGDGSWTVTNEDIGESFASKIATYGVKVVTGDFNGNGKTDIALVKVVSPGWNTIPIAFALENGKWNITNGFVGNFGLNFATDGGVEVITGDFDGNGITDIGLVALKKEWLTIPIAFASGDGGWRQITNMRAQNFAKQIREKDVQILVGKFKTEENKEFNKRPDGIVLVKKSRSQPWDTIPMAYSRMKKIKVISFIQKFVQTIVVIPNLLNQILLYLIFCNTQTPADTYAYIPVIDFPENAFMQGFVKFSVSTDHDAHIALGEDMNHDGVHYEIVLGGWDNTLSVIRGANQSKDVLARKEEEVLKKDGYIMVQIVWNPENLVVYISRSNNTAQFVKLMEFTNRGSSKFNYMIKHMMICTGFRSNGGSWEIIDHPE